MDILSGPRDTVGLELPGYVGTHFFYFPEKSAESERAKATLTAAELKSAESAGVKTPLTAA